MIQSSEYRCPQRPKEGIEFPEARIRVVNCLTRALGMYLGPLQEHAFNSETPLLPSPILTLKPRAIRTEGLAVETVLSSEKTHRGWFWIYVLELENLTEMEQSGWDVGDLGPSSGLQELLMRSLINHSPPWGFSSCICKRRKEILCHSLSTIALQLPQRSCAMQSLGESSQTWASLFFIAS